MLGKLIIDDNVAGLFGVVEKVQGGGEDFFKFVKILMDELCFVDLDIEVISDGRTDETNEQSYEPRRTDKISDGFEIFHLAFLYSFMAVNFQITVEFTSPATMIELSD